MGIELSIRLAQAGELSQLVPLDQGRWPMEHCVSAFQDPRQSLLVAENRGVVVGYIVYQQVFQECHIYNMAVIPSCWGRGIGRRLLRACFDRARPAVVFLEVRRSNRIAQGLYLSAGFEAIYQRPGYYSDGEPAIVMKCELTP